MRRPPHRWRDRRPRTHLHHRPRQRDRLPGDPLDDAARRGAHARVDPRRPPRVLARARAGFAVPLARAREGRDGARACRNRERGVGPRGAPRRQAAVAHARRHAGRGTGRRDRLPRDPRRGRRGRVPRDGAGERRDPRRTDRARRARGIPRVHDQLRLDRLLRRHRARALPRSDPRRLHALQDEDRPVDRRRCAPRAHHPRGNRPRPRADGRREPALRCAAGD